MYVAWLSFYETFIHILWLVINLWLALEYGVPFVSKFSDVKFTYLLLKMSKNQVICKSRTVICKSRTTVY